ncbi:hypothetical protein SLS53_005358 [Cytospora paraplurivora]|uniref:Peptidase A1 domain-containing protein n=1 Tax=Cytospora paraplurivora TaxID=2898453 RepID=A0AAN9YGF3_9PEZI
MIPLMSLGYFATALLLSGALANQDGYLRHSRPSVNDTSSTGLSPAVANIKSLDTPEFTVRQIRNPHFRRKSGLQAMLDVYAKYKIPLTPQLKRAASVNGLVINKKVGTQTGTTSATPPGGYDYEFVCPVDIGTPPQTISLNFDSGSSDLWVFSNDTNPNEVQGQGIFDASQSTTAALMPGYNFTIAYGDGNSASGIVYTDTVAVGNASITGMTVESAIEVSPGFSQDAPAAGILGLGQSTGNTVYPNKQLTFLDTIKSSLAAPLFTANLIASNPGDYDFGYIDSSKYTGRIQYGSIDPTSIYWQFAATGYRIGPEPNASNPNQGYTTLPWRAIADTGTTLLLVPDQIVSDYYAQVPGAGYDSGWGGILFPCTAATTLPDFTFGIGLYKGTVPGRYINYGAINTTTCFGGIQTMGTATYGIMGDILLKAQFVVFDSGNQRVGFANKVLLY